MKRFLSMIIVLIMVCSVFTVFAEAPAESVEPEPAVQTAAASSTGFNFRNGITWGMSPEEVRTAENRDESSFREDGSITALMYGYTDVSKYTADHLLYLFSDNKLVSAVYIFTSSWSDATCKYITGALTELYGEPVEMTKEDITSEMSFYSGFDGSAITSVNGWTTESALVRTAVDTELDITYIDPNFSTSASYNTSGL